MLVTSLRMVADIERAGDMALHVAKLARRRYPSSAVPSALRPTILEMGQVAQLIMTKAGDGHRGERRGAVRQSSRTTTTPWTTCTGGCSA